MDQPGRRSPAGPLRPEAAHMTPARPPTRDHLTDSGYNSCSRPARPSHGTRIQQVSSALPISSAAIRSMISCRSRVSCNIRHLPAAWRQASTSCRRSHNGQAKSPASSGGSGTKTGRCRCWHATTPTSVFTARHSRTCSSAPATGRGGRAPPAAAMGGDRFLGVFAQVVPQMPAISNLDRLRRLGVHRPMAESGIGTLRMHVWRRRRWWLLAWCAGQG
jgi:hypothetical protein